MDIGPVGARNDGRHGYGRAQSGHARAVGSTVMFACGNAVVKWQLGTSPLGEVDFGRTVFAFLTVAAMLLPRAGWDLWH